MMWAGRKPRACPLDLGLQANSVKLSERSERYGSKNWCFFPAPLKTSSDRPGKRVASRWGWFSGAVPLGPHPRLRRPPSEQHVLAELERQAVLVYTPSRKVHGKRLVCYDDRYIVKVAYEQDGVIVSNDNYRDLQSENPEWKWFIEQRLLMFSFVNDR